MDPGCRASPDPPSGGAHGYSLGREIARGGMGAIVEATDRKLSRRVAVKVLMPDSDADEGMRRRFLREAAVLARLEHPNIVPIHDLVWEGGQPLFYTMKLVRGRTLHQILADIDRGEEEGRRTYPLDHLLTVFRKVCDAVAFAHSRQILHRDLKPENIMVGEFGEVLVMDWGVAKWIGAPDDDAAWPEDAETALPGRGAGRLAAPGMSRTQEGAVIGTPHFMSPEQARGAVSEHDVRSDVFSLGAILYAILTLRPPVDGSTMQEVLENISSARITPPDGRQPVDSRPSAAVRPGSLPHCPAGRVPTALSAVAMKALSLERGDRFQSVDELAADIDRYQSGFATRAERAGLSKEILLLVRRHRAAAGLLSLLLLVTTGFLLKVMGSERRAQAEKQTARLALASSSLSLAEAALRDGNATAVRAALAGVPPELRDGNWEYLQEESDTSRRLPGAGLEEFDDLVPHPAQAGVFWAASRGRVVAFRAEDGASVTAFRPSLAAESPGPGLRIAVTGSGDLVAVGQAGARGVALHRTVDGSEVTRWPSLPVRRLEFSPDGSKVLVSSWSNHRIEVRNAIDGAVLWETHDAYQNEGRFAGTDNSIISYTWDRQLHVLDAATGEVGAPFTSAYFMEFAVRPGGGLAVAGNVLGTVKGFDLSTGAARYEFHPHDSKIERVAFLPGGERFLTAATLPDGRQALQCWNAATGAPCENFTGGRGDIRHLAVHPLSGELVVSGSGGNRVWRTGSLPQWRAFRSGEPHPSAAFWGQDDVLFAPGPPGTGTSADLQAVAGDHPVILWGAGDSCLGQPSISADGRRAALGRYNSWASIIVLERDGTSVTPMAEFPPTQTIDRLRLSPTGDRLALLAGGFSQLAVVDVAAGKPVVTLESRDIHRFNDAAWIDSGNRLAALATTKAPRSAEGSEEMLVVWEAATGRRLQAVPGHGVSDVLCASPDGSLLAEAGADRVVRIRDALTLAVRLEFRAHNAPLTAMAWHPSRPVLATGSQDLTIRLWSLTDGRRCEDIRGPLAPPTVLSFSPGGRRLAAASRDGVARVYEPRSLAHD